VARVSIQEAQRYPSRIPARDRALRDAATGDPGLRAALASWDNATVTEGSMGDGFYEAVVSTLMERR